MPLSESQRRIVQQSIDNLKNIWLSQGRERYFPNLLEAAKIEPEAVIQVVPILAGYLDQPIRQHAFHALEMLSELALSAEILQKQINQSLNPKITELTEDFYPHVARAAGARPLILLFPLRGRLRYLHIFSIFPHLLHFIT